MQPTTFERRKNPLLDGIRGLAISSVLVFHAFFELTPQTVPEYVIRKTFAPFWIGVNIFFVLSGFLITGILIDTKGSPHYFQSFYARRILRIFPLYFVVLGCVFFLLPGLHFLPSTPFHEQLSYWTYTYNWSAASGRQAFGLVHFWSLAVEEQFYVVWPILLFFTPVRRMPALLIAFLSASFLFRVALFLFDQPSRYAYFLTPSRIEDLCFGALAAWIVRDSASLARARQIAPRLAWVFAGLFALALAIGKGFEANKWPALLFGTTAVCGLTALAILKSAVETRSRWWGNSGLGWLGTYSYGIYVFHQPIMRFVNSRLSGASLPGYVFAMTAAVAASCLTAWISYHFLERRFLQWKVRFPPNF